MDSSTVSLTTLIRNKNAITNFFFKSTYLEKTKIFFAVIICLEIIKFNSELEKPSTGEDLKDEIETEKAEIKKTEQEEDSAEKSEAEEKQNESQNEPDS